MLYFSYNRQIDSRYVPNCLNARHPRLPFWIEQKEEYAVGFCASPLEQLIESQGVQLHRQIGPLHGDQPYVIPIESLYSMATYLITYKDHNFNFWKEIEATYGQDLRAGKAIILLCEFKKLFEGDGGDLLHSKQDWFGRLHQALKRYNIPPRQCVALCAAPEIEEQYARYQKEHGLFLRESMQVHYCNFYEMAWLKVAQEYLASGRLKKSTDDMTLAREKFFLFTNNESRYHRRAFYAWLKTTQLDQLGHISFLNRRKHTYVEKNYDQKFTDADVDQWREAFDSLDQELPLVLDCKEVHLTDYHSWPYEQSYFSIVSERIFQSTPGWTLPTAKIYKTMHSLHPFIVLGQSGMLASLRSRGYETFPELFDESYDEETCPNKRFQMVQKEVEKVCSWPKEKLHHTYHQLLPRLLINREKLEARWRHSEFHHILGLMAQKKEGSDSLGRTHNEEHITL